MKKRVLCLAFVAIASTSLSAQILQHEVRDGETLYGISRRYAISINRLSESNNLESPELLLPGTLLTIPNRYAVEKGDTLFSIAGRFNTSVEAITDANGLSSSSIRAGQIITLPNDATVRIATPDTSADTSMETSIDNTTTGDQSEGAADPSGTTSSPRSVTNPVSVETIVVAAEVSDPLSYIDGGAWPVAGNRRNLDGKLPGVMIRAERGTPVYAISSGRVVYAGPHTTFGNVVFIQSTQDYVYVYGGQESVGVEVGEMIEAGTAIGTVGISPSEGSAALYFSVWRDDRFVDPEAAPRG